MRSPIQFVVIAAIAAAGLAVPRPAAAQCDFACVEDANFCQRCVYLGPGSGNCQNVGSCGCFDVQCYEGFTADERLRIDLGIAPKAPEVKLCAARTEPAAVSLPFRPLRS